MNENRKNLIKEYKGLTPITILKNVSIWSSLLPDVKSDLESAEKIINAADCTSCARNRVGMSTLKKVMVAYNKSENLNITPLKAIVSDKVWSYLNGDLTEDDVDTFEGTYRQFVGEHAVPTKEDRQERFNKVNDNSSNNPNNNNYNKNIERTNCIECSCKHLAQASILLKESLQGYPEHVVIAEEHIDAAIKIVSEQGKSTEDLIAIKESIRPVIAASAPGLAIDHITTAINLMNTYMHSDETKHPTLMWKIIGHLSEASDECVLDHPDFANFLREERLKLMKDFTYDIPLLAILDQCRTLLEKDIPNE